MSKIIEPNYQILLSSAIYSLQNVYIQYKKAINECLNWTFIDGDGEFCVLEGYEERYERVNELSREILRLQFEVKELKGKQND